MVKIRVENTETFARLNFLRDLAMGCFEGDPIKKWGDMPKDEKEMYLKEAEECSDDYVLTLQEIKAISNLI